MDLTTGDQRLAAALGRLAGINAVAIGGSRASGLSDSRSDTDMYAFHRGALPTIEERQRALTPIIDSQLTSVDAFGPEDHFTVAGHDVEIVYLDLDELTAEVDRAHNPGLMSEGFTTCFLHTLATCVTAHDDGSLADIKARLRTYPAATRRRIITETPDLMDAFFDQLTKAQLRGDLTMVTHRRASIQAAWFNVLFALNNSYHPGEKRLLQHAESLPLRPSDIADRWRSAQLARADSPALDEELRSLTHDLFALTPELDQPGN